MHYKCALENLEFFAHHGLHDEERLTGGKFLVNLSVEMAKNDHELLRDLKEVINYEDLFELIQFIMEHPEDLIETVAKNILDKVDRSYNDLSRIEVTITKLNPAGIFKSGHASVTLSRTY